MTDSGVTYAVSYSDTASTDTVKRRRYTDSSTDTYRWISVNYIADNTYHIDWKHDYIDEKHTVWITEKVKIFKKYHGQPPKFNEKLWLERFMKLRQNKSRLILPGMKWIQRYRLHNGYL